MKLNHRLVVAAALLLLIVSGPLTRSACALEQMDNAELLKLIKAGVTLPVINEKIKVSDAHFTSTNAAVVEIQSACTEAKWKEADVVALQTQVIAIAGRENKRLKELVDQALNVFENADPAEYDLMMRTLMRAGKEVLPYLLPKVDEESERKRGGVVDAVGRIGDCSDTVVRVAVTMLFDRSKPVRLQAAKCVAALKGTATFDELCLRLKNRNEKQDGVALALGYLEDPRGIDPLVQLLRYSADPDARVCAAFSLGLLRARSAPAIDALLESVLDERDDKLRQNAAHALMLVGEPRAPSYIIRAFQRYRPGREDLLRELGYSKDTAAIVFLLEQTVSDVPALKKAAVETLRLISGEEHLETSEEWRTWWEVNKTRPDWIHAGTSNAGLPVPGGR